MNHTAELEKALTDLRHITGISMEIHAETEEEVTKALEQLKPYAIDVSSGIETEGRKDKRKMAAIMKAVRKERKL